MGNDKWQRSGDELAPKRRRGKVRLVVVSVLCAVVVCVGVAGVCGVLPFAGAGMKELPPAAAIGASANGDDAGESASSENAPQPSNDSPTDAADQSSTEQKRQSKPARTPSGQEVPEEAIPQVNAEHRQDDVLVSFAQGYTAEDLTAAIDKSGCTVAQPITDADISAGFVTLKVADDYDVAHAMTQLGMLPEIKGAQPNFIYHLQDETLGNGAADLQASVSGASAGGNGSVGLQSKANGASSSANGTADMRASVNGASTLATGASADSLIANATSVNDPFVSKQWALESIHAYEAWDTVKSNGNVTVAVFDNGCLTTHEDFAGNIAEQYDAINDDNKVGAGEHGTHVAGIISATANNAKGIAGVSYNAKILPVQVLDEKGEGDSESVLKAFRYVLDKQPSVKVINMSFGGSMSYDSIVGDDELADCIDEAYGKGILTVCSAGNDVGNRVNVGTSYRPKYVTFDGAYYNYPSDWAENALGVIALAEGTAGGDPKRVSYSNYNMAGQKTKDISAPGDEIYSTYSSGNASYRNMSGTSMAAPVVTGVAALVYAASPDSNAAEVADVICQNANKINASAAAYDASGFSLEYGYGEVDAEAAVRTATSAHLRGDADVLKGATTKFEIVNLSSAQASGSWSWTSSNQSIARVAGGTVTGVSEGTATITATLNSGDLVLKKEITVHEGDFSGASAITVGSAAAATFTATPSNESWHISSSNESIVTVTPTRSVGKSTTLTLFGVACGTTTITATLVANPKVKVTRTITVQPINLSGASVSVSGKQVYTGAEIKPKPTVTLQQNSATLRQASAKQQQANATPQQDGAMRQQASTLQHQASTLQHQASTLQQQVSTLQQQAGSTLKEGVDYTVSYENNKNAGTAKVIVKGKGNYTGTAIGTFVIDKAEVAVPIASNGLVYNGAEQTGVKAGNGFTVSGNTATNAGSYQATVALKDEANYRWAGGTSAKRTIAWSIARASLSRAVMTGVPMSRRYTGKAIKPSVSVNMGTQTLRSGIDYTLSYANNKNAGTATITASGMDNYTGTLSAKFKVTKAPAKVKAATSKKFTVKALKKARKFTAFSMTTDGKRTFKIVKRDPTRTLTFKAGKVTVKKRAKAGTYKLRVKVSAKSGRNYAALKAKTYTIKVKVTR